MNSVIEAQIEFTECIGEITMQHLFMGLTLPLWSNEAVEVEKFIRDCQRPTPPHQTIPPVKVYMEREYKENNIQYKFL